MIHRSKVDSWLALVLGAAIVFPLVLGAGILVAGNDEEGPAWLPLLVSVVVDLLILAILYPLYYRIEPTTLLIRSGVLRWRVPLADIREIRPTRNPLSSPALSLDRLEVRYGAKRNLDVILVSPKDKAAFLEDIVRASPGLVRQGDSVVRGA